MNRTAIEWTDSTWSPLRVRVRADAAQIARDRGYTSLVQIADRMAGRVGPHCEHVSPGCANCYAETNNHRCLPANSTGLPYDRRSRDLVEPFVDEKILLQPLRWKPIQMECTSCGSDHTLRGCPEQVFRPRRIFVENQSDLFGEWVTDEMLDRVFAVMALCPQHIFQVLTKRPARMLRYCSDTAMRGMGLGHDVVTRIADQADLAPAQIRQRWPLSNVWLGVSVENQAAADERIPLLLRTPAAVRFISAEPLLGPVRLDWPRCYLSLNRKVICGEPPQVLPAVDWVIAGGESGPGARPVHPDWVRSLRDQCQQAGVPFFFKQWGEWLEFARTSAHEGTEMGEKPGQFAVFGPNHPREGRTVFKRVGKHAAGALLDGREYREFPEVHP